MDDLELFDDQAFDQALVGQANRLPLFRDALRRARAVLAERFEADVPIDRLVTGHACLLDRLLVRVWCCASTLRAPDLALVAVGGYGRGELHPHSDVDLMILAATDAARERHREYIERFLLFLWDIGVEVGHSVRTVEECVEQARADITVATNLMESRLLAGPEGLYQRMKAATGKEQLWPDRAFFEAKWQEQIARHRKFHGTAYNLEPNVKEGPGGLRDIQMIGWVAKRHFGAGSLQDLVAHGFLTAAELDTLIQGQNFLWRVRWGLHQIARRREDRLLFDHQRALARQFGYTGDGPALAVEAFMKAYYRTVMELERLNEMLLQLFQEEILLADQTEEPVSINKRFQTRRGFIETVHPRVFDRYPFALLEIFLLLQQHPQVKGVRAETIRQIRSHRHRIDDAFRRDLRCRSLFMEILRQPHGITCALRRMNRYGILGAYLPAFEGIIGQMQHDLFHVYTVDVHTLFVIRNLRRFAIPHFTHEFPICSELTRSVAKLEILYIAALFHDIAKGRGGDHSQLGAEEVAVFCRGHALSEYDTRLAAWLVRHHLLMSTTAQRKDISDPDVINTFAAQVGDTVHLDYLYLLTVADIRATSPTLWNSWKDALLADLYQSTRHALHRGLTNPIDKDELIRDAQDTARHLLAQADVPDAAVDALWARMTEDYFVRYSADEIAWHARGIIENARPDEPLVLVRQQTLRGGTEVFIYTHILSHQFTVTTTVLDQLGLTIAEARIIPSLDAYTLDTYIVLEENGTPIRDTARLDEIHHTLAHLLRHPQRVPGSVQRHLARHLKHFTVPTEVNFQDDPINQRTIMEVVTTDRPGLLSKLARAMDRCAIQLRNAKIATFGERVEDVFFITDREGRPLAAPQARALLRDTIVEEIEGRVSI